jgi:hypothetical protein
VSAPEADQTAGEPAPLDRAMVMALNSVAAVAVALALGGLALKGWSAAMGIAAGGFLATINLWVLGWVTRGVLSSRGRLHAVVGAVKFLALMGAAYLLLRAGLASGLTLAIGYASLPVGLTIGTLLSRPST